MRPEDEDFLWSRARVVEKEALSLGNLLILRGEYELLQGKRLCRCCKYSLPLTLNSALEAG